MRGISRSSDQRIKANRADEEAAPEAFLRNPQLLKDEEQDDDGKQARNKDPEIDPEQRISQIRSCPR